MLGLIGACKALPDFDTLQIVYAPDSAPPSGHESAQRWVGLLLSRRRGEQVWLRGQVKAMKDWATEYLRRPETGHHKAEGRGTTLRVIELGPAYPQLPRPGEDTLATFYLDPVKVEEYVV